MTITGGCSTFSLALEYRRSRSGPGESDPHPASIRTMLRLNAIFGRGIRSLLSVKPFGLLHFE